MIAFVRTTTIYHALFFMVYISFRNLGLMRRTNHWGILVGKEWRKWINNHRGLSSVYTLVDIPGFPFCRIHPWSWNILHGVKLALRKTKTRMIYLSPKITSRALKSPEGETVRVLYIADLGGGRIDNVQICCPVCTSFQRLDAHQKVREEEHSTKQQQQKYLTLLLASRMLGGNSTGL